VCLQRVQLRVPGEYPVSTINCISFTTAVSARFSLMDCQRLGEEFRTVADLFCEAMLVLFMSKFVVFVLLAVVNDNYCK